MINEAGGVQGPNPIQPQRTPSTQKAKPAAPAQASDRVEISPQARFLQKLHEVEPVRQDKIDAVRAQIEAGTYDTEDKLQIAVDKLLEDLG